MYKPVGGMAELATRLLQQMERTAKLQAICSTASMTELAFLADERPVPEGVANSRWNTRGFAIGGLTGGAVPPQRAYRWRLGG